MVATSFRKDEKARWQAYKATYPGESEYVIVKRILLAEIERFEKEKN